jgi:hypothetical protein
MDEHDDSFYRERTWDLLFEEINSIKRSQQAQAKDITDIKSQLRWIMGIATGITIAVNVAWTFLKNNVLKSFS